MQQLILPIKQLHQNLDLANIKPKDLAGTPIAKGFFCIIYIYTHIRMHRYHWFQAIFVLPFKPIRLLNSGYLHAWRLAKDQPNQGTPPGDGVQFQQPLPVKCAWHPWDEDFSTNVHLDRRWAPQKSVYDNSKFVNERKTSCTKKRESEHF